MESYLKGLNEEQLEAVKHNEGPCMVLAGPGTGKTTVITSRIANLIEKKVVPPENILVVTFSRAAANEMKERYVKLSGTESARKVSFGTFHSIFFKLLREHMGYKLEDLLDENQKFNVLRNIIRGLIAEFAEDEGQIREIISDMEYIISTMSDAASYKPSSCESRQLIEIMEAYRVFKQQSHKYDYDDILNDCFYMLEKDAKILNETRNKFKYILVDEFQDINALQFETIKLIAEPLNNIFIVGDDDQSIYGFRGAAPDILLNFEKLYPKCSKAYLKNNYRTTGNILTSALSVINTNKNRYSKYLESVNSQGSFPVTFEADDFEAEAKTIATRIGQISGSGMKFSDFAVIYRTNLQSRAIIDAFMDAGIPFVTLDGIISMYNHWIFKDVMSYFKLGTGLWNNRDIIRIINKPKRYISRETLEKAEKQSGDFLQSIMNQSSLNRLQVNGMLEFKNDIKRLGVMNPQNAVKYIRNVIGYDEYLKEYAASKGISTKGLRETIEEIESSVSSFQSIALYMQHVALVAERLGEKGFKDLGHNNVKLLTMHKAKGLEFNIVFLCGSVEGLTPYIKDDSDTDFEEERRLYYVAMTRAKRELYITIPKHRYGKAVKPSRFVEEFKKCIDYSRQVHIGQKVYHKIYYDGVIKEVIDSKEGARIKVDFDGSLKDLKLKTCLEHEIIRLL